LDSNRGLDQIAPHDVTLEMIDLEGFKILSRSLLILEMNTETVLEEHLRRVFEKAFKLQERQGFMA
jgi:hypothetical protein